MLGVQSLPWCLSVLLATWAVFVSAQDGSDLKYIPLRTHSLVTPYLDSELQSRWWDFGGSTIIRTDRYVRLTGTQQSQAGWIFTRVPLTATNWEVEFEFKVSGSGTLYGDGLAMWVTTGRGEQGDVFGMKDKFEGLGLFIDTYKNNRPGVVFPYVYAMLGDGQTPYDKANDGKANELAGCSARGLRNTDVPTKAKVTYFQDKELSVELQYKKEDEWTKCFSVPGIKLPNAAYLGFSAETGELSDKHDIIRVDTRNLYSPTGSTGPAGGRDFSRGKGRRTREEKSGGWGWFFFKFILLGFAVAGAYVGFTAYRARRRDRF